MKKSFFGSYFAYKLKGHIGFIAASAALSLCGYPAILTLLRIYAYAMPLQEQADSGYLWTLGILIIALAEYVVPLTSAGLMILSFIMPVVSFRFYNNRAFVDCVGSLPLSYNQRFAGDFLSGLCAVAVPNALFIPITLILAKSVEKTGEFELSFGDFARRSVLLFIVVVSAYAFSALITSCCGKAGASVFYSMAAAVVLPTVVYSYAAVFCQSGVGLSESETGNTAISAIAPAGPMFSVIFDSHYLAENLFEDYSFPQTSALGYVIMAAFTAAYSVGAYFVGKHRRTERVGNDFTNERAYTVVSVAGCCALWAVIWGFTESDEFTAHNPGFYVKLTLAFAAFMTLEIIHKKSAKKIPKSILKFAAVGAACFAACGVLWLTKGFGYSDIIPEAAEIESAQVESNAIYSYGNKPFFYDDPEAIKTIVEQHKIIISDKSLIKTGSELKISYKLKNGMTIKRGYRDIEDSEVLKKASEVISTLPTSTDAGGILELKSGEFSDLKIFGNYYSYGDGGISDYTDFVIKPEKTEELRQILAAEKKELSSQQMQNSDFQMTINISYTVNGEKRTQYFNINEQYKNTVQFVMNSENCTALLSEEDDSLYRALIYFGEESTERITVYFKPYSAEAKELLNLCAASDNEKSDKIEVTNMENYMTFGVKKSDEKRAAELIMRLVKADDRVW